MFISVRDDETNFAWHFDGAVEIKLDGKLVWGCCEADDENGFIVQYARDARGNLIVVDNELQTVKSFGKVEFIGKRREPMEFNQ